MTHPKTTYLVSESIIVNSGNFSCEVIHVFLLLSRPVAVIDQGCTVSRIPKDLNTSIKTSMFCVLVMLGISGGQTRLTQPNVLNIHARNMNCSDGEVFNT